MSDAQTGDRLLTEVDFRARLGGMGERQFKLLRARGIVPPPLELGPRAPRWTEGDFRAAVANLPRRQVAPEPATLAQGRRARIDAMKAQGTPA